MRIVAINRRLEPMPPHSNLRVLENLPLLLGLALTAGCSNLSLSPYRIDVRQGNLVTQEMVSQLQPGMTRDQVRFLLGTPLLADPFHAERWDYVYRFKPGYGDAQLRRLTVFFQDGKLARVAGDVVPAVTGPAVEPAVAEPAAQQPPPAATPGEASPKP
jgi:outer membrane protein assembly factor BamE